jgi:hypothetical protein
MQKAPLFAKPEYCSSNRIRIDKRFFAELLPEDE